MSQKEMFELLLDKLLETQAQFIDEAERTRALREENRELKKRIKELEQPMWTTVKKENDK